MSLVELGTGLAVARAAAAAAAAPSEAVACTVGTEGASSGLHTWLPIAVVTFVAAAAVAQPTVAAAAEAGSAALPPEPELELVLVPGLEPELALEPELGPGHALEDRVLGIAVEPGASTAPFVPAGIAVDELGAAGPVRPGLAAGSFGLIVGVVESFAVG